MTQASQAQANNIPIGRWVAWVPGGIALILMTIATIFILVERHEVTVAERMRSWPSAIGSTSISRGVARMDDGSWGEFIYTGVQYEVAGHPYKLSIREYGGRSTTGVPPKQNVIKNDSARIYYDPSNPSDWSLTNDRPAGSGLKWLRWLFFVLAFPFLYLAARWYRTPLR